MAKSSTSDAIERAGVLAEQAEDRLAPDAPSDANVQNAPVVGAPTTEQPGVDQAAPEQVAVEREDPDVRVKLNDEFPLTDGADTVTISYPGGEFELGRSESKVKASVLDAIGESPAIVIVEAAE